MPIGECDERAKVLNGAAQAPLHSSTVTTIAQWLIMTKIMQAIMYTGG